jgi:hypothetical protein
VYRFTKDFVVTRQQIALGSPAVLIATMYVLFRTLSGKLGYPLGYLVAFTVYWIAWCGVLPVAVLGPAGVCDLFKAGKTRLRDAAPGTHAMLWWPLVFPLAFAFPRIVSAAPAIILASVALGVVTGVAEELLWRGVYLSSFPENRWLNTTYPSLAFGLWHLCPLSVLPSRYPGGIAIFVIYSTLLGFSYATAARRMESIRWCTISHCVHDVLGLGGFAYGAWLR